MPYCRKCGAKLDDNARFCRVCGAPVEGVSTPHQPPYRTRRPAPALWPVVGVLIAVLVIAFLFAAFAFIPAQSVNFSQSYPASASPGVDALKLTFDADVASLNVIPADLSGQFARLDVSATGSTGFLGNANQPVNVSVTEQTVGGTADLNYRLRAYQMWPFSYNLQVTCNLYVSRDLPLDLSATTTVGSITFNPNFPLEFQGLTLRSTTGSVHATLTRGITLPRTVSISTTTGSVNFVWGNVKVVGDTSVSLSTTTGSVSLDIEQSGNPGGTVTVDATTTTGSVNPTVNIDGNVGAQITSQTSFGSISTTLQNFNGNKSPVYSINYPAAANFIIAAQTTTGSIHVNAAYGTTASASQPEQIRDEIMAYIQTNHPQTAQFMQTLQWTGGRATPEGIVGYETYFYTTVPSGVVGAAGWTVTLGYLVVPNPIYQVTANYTQAGVQHPYNIVWSGTWQSGVITEASYFFTH